MFKNTRISHLLIVGFAVIILALAILGWTAYLQTEKMHAQTELLYNHPMQVTQALAQLNESVLNVMIARRDLVIGNGDVIQSTLFDKIAVEKNRGEEALKIIENRYLGDPETVAATKDAYVAWQMAGEENDRQILSGQVSEARASLEVTGDLGKRREHLLQHLSEIKAFATNKSIALFEESRAIKEELNQQLLWINAVIVCLALFLIYTLIQNIRKPLSNLYSSVLAFHGGDLNARSTYESSNELGVLASAFNALVTLVQDNMTLGEKTTTLSETLLSLDSAVFFKSALNALMESIGAQMAAAYILNEESSHYVIVESIGLDLNARRSFDGAAFEGEIGRALLSRKIQLIQRIPDQVLYQLSTAGGHLPTRDLMIVPILQENEVIGFISLASVSQFHPQSLALMQRLWVILSARIAGVLAFERIKTLKNAAERSNQTLTIQKSELSAQAAELKQQNNELEMQKIQLDEASRLKTNFLSNMSHELRTPLNSVIALSGVLGRRLKDQIPEDEYSYLEIIERNGRNLLLLINDILDISRIEAGREEIDLTAFNVNNLIDEVITLIKPQADQKGLEIRKTADQSLIMVSDADKCLHILQNLLGNAIKFTEAGYVDITALQREEQLMVTVTDTGIGIAEEHLDSIFDEFKQADGSTSRRFGGTGLGLAIVKKYAELLGGSIAVESVVGEGSRFTLCLPLTAASDGPVEQDRGSGDQPVSGKRPSESIYSSKPKTLMLVDDNESAVIQIKDLVAEMGHRVITAQDGNEAIELFEQTVPDGIILDLMMPDIDGFKLLEMIRHAEPTAHVPVLILTAKHITRDELKFLKRNNIRQLIQKGDVNRTKLQAAIDQMLSSAFGEPIKQKSTNPEISGKPVVLVVEDNPDNMITVKALLAERFTVLEASDGIEGIRMAKSYIPHLILMDIALPGVNGIEALKAIRSNLETEQIPIVALTASAMEHQREAILAEGFDGYITKPILADHFYQILDEVLYG